MGKGPVEEGFNHQRLMHSCCERIEQRTRRKNSLEKEEVQLLLGCWREKGQGNVGGGRLLVWRTEDKAVQAGFC